MTRYKSLIIYELKTLLKNGWISGFGLIFPCVLFLLVSQGIKSEVPQSFQNDILISVFISLSTISPLAIVLLGHGASYSKEYENGVPQRFHLFGISNKEIITSKIIAQLVFVIFSFIIYYIFVISTGIKFYNIGVLFIMMFLLIIQSLAEFLLSHSIVNIVKKFGLTYAITMSLYFSFMIVSGNMGIRFESLPEGLQFIGGKLLPFIEYSKFSFNLFKGNEYDIVAIISTNLVFLAFGLLLFFISRVKDKRSF